MADFIGAVGEQFSIFDNPTGCKLFCVVIPLLFTSYPRNLNWTRFRHEFPVFEDEKRFHTTFTIARRIQFRVHDPSKFRRNTKTWARSDNTASYRLLRTNSRVRTTRWD